MIHLIFLEGMLANVRAAALAPEGRAQPAPRPFRLMLAESTGRLLEVTGLRRQPDPWLTPYPCRLPNGKMGRAAAVLIDGEWTLQCRLAR